MHRNERGSTLLIVLLIITLILLFGLVLLGNTITSAKQKNKSEKHMQTTHLAEMGVTHLQERLNHLTNDEITTLNQHTVQSFLEDIALTVTSPHLPAAEKRYRAEVESISHQEKTSVATFLVEGKVGNERVTLTPSFTLKYPEGFNSVKDIENGLTPKPLPKPFTTKDEKYSLPIGQIDTIEDDVLFKKGAAIGSNAWLSTNSAEFTENVSMNQNSTLHVRGDGQFKGLDSATGSKILIDGNAFFNQRLMITNKISLLHIKGNAKFHNGFELTAGPNAIINGSMYFDARGQNFQIESGGVLTIDGDLFIRMNNFEEWFLDLRGTIVVKGNVYLATKKKSSSEDESKVNPDKVGDASLITGIPAKREEYKNRTIYVGKGSSKTNWSATLDTVEY